MFAKVDEIFAGQIFSVAMTILINLVYFKKSHVSYSIDTFTDFFNTMPLNKQMSL